MAWHYCSSSPCRVCWGPAAELARVVGGDARPEVSTHGPDLARILGELPAWWGRAVGWLLGRGGPH